MVHRAIQLAAALLPCVVAAAPAPQKAVVIGGGWAGFGAAWGLAQRGVDVPFAYNRKEKKDHGEGGLLVGAPVKGKRVLIVDDVITAGTAIRQAMKILTEAGATAAGVVIALDRAEIVNEESTMSAIQSVEAEFSIPVVSIVGLDQLISYVGEEMPDKVAAVKEYRQKYGVHA